MSNEVVLVIQTDEDGARSIDRVTQDAGGGPGLITQPKHLSGDTSVWVVALTAVIQTLPLLLGAVGDLADRGRIGAIEVDGVKIENPTSEMVEQLLAERRADRDVDR